MANSEKISLREALRSNGRAFAIAWRKWPKVFIATALCQTMHALSPYIGIYLSAQLVNELAGARDVQRLQSWVWAALLSAAVLALLTAVFQRWQNYERDVFHTDLYEIFGKKMTEMDYSCAVADKTLDDLSQIRQNSNCGAWGLYRIWSFFQTAVKSLLSALGAVVLTVSLFTSRVPVESRFAFLNHPAFILAMLGAMAGAILLSSLCGNRISQCWADSAEVNKFGNRIFGYFGYFPSDRSRTMDIRIYNQMRVVSNRLMQFNVYNLTSVLAQRAKKTMGPLEALRAGVSVVFTGGVYLFTCIKAWAGAFGVGSVTQYVGAFTALMGSVAQLFGIVGNMRANAAFLRPVFAFLDVGHEMYQGSLTVEKRSDRKYEIEFRDVSFRYPGSRQYALRHVSMKFRVGERLAIVGQNGSGKTTFIKLLCRLYDPTEGEILLNGIDIRKYDYQEYMSIFSIVFQDFQLLSFTLGENVATRKTYDRERASRCLRQAGFGARLDALENGLDSYLYHDYEEGGIEISGGEAQKIAIARALYKDAPFIILDEPTAALDPIAESEVYTNFDTLVGDKTAIYISHRLSSCRFCDTIAVFDEGQVVQRGTHQQLAAQEGKYAALWNAQAQYYQKKEE